MKAKRLVAVLGAMCALLFTIAAANMIHTQKLKNMQAEALAELAESAGDYSEKTLALYNTSAASANRIAQKLGARVTMSSSGDFASLALPAHMTVQDVYADDAYLSVLPYISVDYLSYNCTTPNTEDDEIGYPVKMPDDSEWFYKYDFTVEEPDYEFQNGPGRYKKQAKALAYCNLGDIWNYTKGEGVTIAYIDTGLDVDHEDLQYLVENRLSPKSINISTGQTVEEYGVTAIDDGIQTHGTNGIGTISATFDNGLGVNGVASEATILVIKANYNKGYANSDLVNAIYYAADCGADIINMSWGRINKTDPFEGACQYAYEHGCIMFCGAGNSDTAQTFYPACNEHTIGIGGLDYNWVLAGYSDYGPNSDMVTIGTTMTTNNPHYYEYDSEYNYYQVSGTSFATPIVSASVALYLSMHGKTDPDTMRELLYASNKDLGIPGNGYYFGYGALDVYELVMGEQGTLTYDFGDGTTAQAPFYRGHGIQYPYTKKEGYDYVVGWCYDKALEQPVRIGLDIFEEDVTLYAVWFSMRGTDGVELAYDEALEGYVVTGYSGTDAEVYIPATSGGVPVVAVADEAFAHNTDISLVCFNAHLSAIGNNAFFGCTGLKSVIFFGEDLKEIGSGAFAGCTSLGSLEIPQSVEKIGSGALADCAALSKLTIPFVGTEESALFGSLFGTEPDVDLVKLTQTYAAGETADYYIPKKLKALTVSGGKLGYGALSGLTNFNSISLFVTEAEAYALKDLSISELALPEVTKMAPCALADANILTLTLPFIGTTAQQPCTLAELYGGTNGSLYKLTVLGGAVAPSAMENWGITAVVFGDGVTGIGANALLGAKKLTSVTISASVETIDGNFLQGCTYLANLTVAEGNPTFDSEDNVLYSGTKLVAVAANRSSTGLFVREGTVSIGQEAAKDCFRLTSVSLPQSVRAVERDAFAGCTGLTDLYYPGFADDFAANVAVESGNEPLFGAELHVELYFTVVYHTADGGVYAQYECLYGMTASTPWTDDFRLPQGDQIYRYVLAGWDYDGDGQAEDAPVVVGAMDAYPVLEKVYIDYTITFVSDGETVDTQKLHYGDAIVLPEEPQKASANGIKYTFLGWKGYTEGMTVTGSQEFVAEFAEEQADIVIRFVNHGETLEFTYAYGEEMKRPATPESYEEGGFLYVFTYWTDPEGNIFLAGDVAEKDTVYTAHYKKTDLPPQSDSDSSSAESTERSGCGIVAGGSFGGTAGGATLLLLGAAAIACLVRRKKA